MQPSSTKEEIRKSACRGGDGWDGRESWGWGAWFGFSCGFPAYDYHPYDYPYDHDPFSASFMLAAAASPDPLSADAHDGLDAQTKSEEFDWGESPIPTPQPNGG